MDCKSDCENMISFDFLEDFKDDFYFAEGYKNFSVTARRESKNRLRLKECIFDYMELEDRSALRAYLLNFPKDPCLVRTEIGTAVVYGDLFSVLYGFYFSFISAEENGRLFKYFAKGDERLIPVSEEILAKDRRKMSTRLLSDFVTVLKTTTDALMSPETKLFMRENDPAEIYKDKVEKLALVGGCTVNYKYSACNLKDMNLDHKLLTAFILSSFMLCRRKGENRCADLELFSLSEKATARVTFETDDDIMFDDMHELDVFLSIAERNDMYFDCFRDGKTLNIILSPVRVDWSIYGLKNEPVFDWMGNEPKFWQKLKRQKSWAEKKIVIKK